MGVACRNRQATPIAGLLIHGRQTLCQLPVSQSTNNFFELFGLPQTYAIDVDALAAKYRELQGDAHPDRHSGADEAAKMRAVQLTSLINEGFATLKSPLKRAGYLLSLEGFDAEQVSQADLSMDLLMEQMQLRESLESLPKDESALDELADLKSDTEQKIAKRQQEFEVALTSNDLSDAKIGRAHV